MSPRRAESTCLWSAEYTGAGRTLQYNDVGYMARQNLHMLKASLGLRELEPGAYTVEKATALEITQNRNLSGLDLGQLYELNGRLKLRNFASVLLAADFAPARFDDREVGNGSILERGRYIGGRFELASDPRGLFYATLANQTQFIASGAFATTAQASVVVHALRQLDIELLPQATWSGGEYRYARQVVDPTNYYFGKLSAQSVSATLRASYTFTPQLTLQAYGQAFLAVGHFDDFRTFPIADPFVPHHSHPRQPGTSSGDADHAAELARLQRRRAQRQRRVPLGVPARVDDLFRLFTLANPDGSGPGDGIRESDVARSARLRPRRHLRRLPAEVLVLVGELALPSTGGR